MIGTIPLNDTWVLNLERSPFGWSKINEANGIKTSEIDFYKYIMTRQLPKSESLSLSSTMQLRFGQWNDGGFRRKNSRLERNERHLGFTKTP